MIGEGGMGAVYQARDLQLNRLMALKVIRPDLAKDPEIVNRFKQELILARQVTHKNVIRIYDLAEFDGLKFITMDFIDGRDLKTFSERTGSSNLGGLRRTSSKFAAAWKQRTLKP